MPLSGGAADKAGNSYERRWTVFVLLDLLEGRGASIRIEVPGGEGVGAEFRVRKGATAEWHQAKRQRDAGPWTIANMAGEGVLDAMWSKIQQGGRFVFVSSTGAQELRELVERASDADGWTEFERDFLTGQQMSRFQRLRSAWGDPTEEEVYRALGAIDVTLIDEPKLAAFIDARLGVLATGPPSAAAAVLAQLADDSRHQELVPAQVWDRLANNAITARNLSQDAVVVAKLADATEAYLARLRQLYISGTELPRTEATDAFSVLSDGGRVLVAGGAGYGKSVVVGQATALARAAGWATLVLSADRLRAADTLYSLGEQLGLPDSPVAVLAGVSGGGACLLVIDQLDAVSVASGRYPERVSIVQDLIGAAARNPEMRVLLACRQFDLDNDRILRAAAADDQTTIVRPGPLSEQVILDTLGRAGLSQQLSGKLIDLLSIPLHLAIYVEIAGSGDTSGIVSQAALYDEYWTVKRRRCTEARGGTDDWLGVVDLLVQFMSAMQQLVMPSALLDELDRQVAVMTSENVLVAEGGWVSFFHETFFDFCFARRFVARAGDLQTLLTSTEQGLFRRAQIRQLLAYQRTINRSSYVTDVAWLLSSPAVRIHLKALVIALVGAVEAPTSDEWAVLRPIIREPSNPLFHRVWQALRPNAAWFPALHDAGDWRASLAADDPHVVEQALWALSGMAREYPREAAAALDAVAEDENRPGRVRDFLRLAGFPVDPGLRDLLMESIRVGYYDEDRGFDLWHLIGGLARRQPIWAVEVVAALLGHSLDAGFDNPFASGPLSAEFQSVPQDAIKILVSAAPTAFVDFLLPLVLEVAGRNAQPGRGGGDVLLDSVWSLHVFGEHVWLRTALLDGLSDALRALAMSDPDRAAIVFQTLRDDPHEAAWFLLARGYAGNPVAFADDAADWLASTPGALHLGYTESSHWISRELLAAITPHCSDIALAGVVNAVIGYTPPYERTYEALRHRGHAELCLLNGITQDRMPEPARRRLAELRRKFQFDDVEPPHGITDFSVPPPIPEDRARKMNDTQWLRAMARHDTSPGVRFRRGHMVGDAGTQAIVLERLAGEEPERFARLLLRLPEGAAEPYIGGLLRGLAGAPLDTGLLEQVCAHARQVGGGDSTRWLARLIGSEAAATVPDDLLRLVAEIAVDDPDPSPEWRRNEEGTVLDIDSAGLNSTRGVAVIAIGDLIREDASRLDALRLALESASTDRAIQVRAMAVATLAHVLFADAPVALALFERCITGIDDDALFTSTYVEGFLNLAIRRGHYAQLSQVLDRMQVSDQDKVRRVAGRQLAVASYLDAGLDSAVDEALTGDDITRAGIVEVFAHNRPTAERRARRQAVLVEALADSSSAVRAAAAECFRPISADERLDDYVPLIEALASSSALEEHAGQLFDVLEATRQPLPAPVLHLCERFVAAHGANLADMSTAAAASAPSVANLAIRLYAQHNHPETRRRCLNLVDQLVTFDVYGIADNLAAVER